jgi:NAD(P)-dependent dehydrogenase (short-subunit alcohol dehydrogenase family)
MAILFTKGAIMGKLEGKVAVITGGSSGMALTSAKRCVGEGAYVFITGQRRWLAGKAVINRAGIFRTSSLWRMGMLNWLQKSRLGPTTCLTSPSEITNAGGSAWPTFPR